MLTDLLLRMSPRQAHRMLALLGINADAFHEWLEGFCPCGVSS